jgi:peptidoglycan-N-acetylglucosamine deacetylase
MIRVIHHGMEEYFHQQEELMKKILIFLTLLALLFSGCASGPASQTVTVKKETAPEQPKKPTPAMDPSVPKLCALTFDDGPDVRQTGLVLDRLEKYKVPATFFLVGQRLNDSTAPVLKRALALGCEFGNHTFGYEDLGGATAEQIKATFDKTTAAIVKYTGKPPKFFRPPNLSTSPVMFATIGLPFMSGIVGYDWDQKTTAESRAKSVLGGMQDGAVILLHDVQPDPHPTPEALDILIPELKNRGYTFVTLSELFARKNVDTASRKNAMWTVVK